MMSSHGFTAIFVNLNYDPKSKVVDVWRKQMSIFLKIHMKFEADLLIFDKLSLGNKQDNNL